MGRAIWVEDRDMSNRETLCESVQKCGADAALVGGQTAMRSRRAGTLRSRRWGGVFGAP